jgi:hypothetical protein
MNFDRDEIKRDLAEANVHFEHGGRVIRCQIALIERFKHNDQFTEAAEELLKAFISVYALWHRRRDSLANRLSTMDRAS